MIIIIIASSSQQVEGLLNLHIEGDFREEVVEVEADLALGRTALTHEVQQPCEAFRELAEGLLDAELFDCSDLREGNWEVADLEGGLECFSEVIELHGQLELFKEQGEDLGDGGRSSILLHVVSHDFFDLLQSDVVDIELHQHFSSTILVAEGLLEDVLDVGAEVGLELEPALWRDGLDDLVKEADDVVDEGVVNLRYNVNVAILAVAGLQAEHADD